MTTRKRTAFTVPGDAKLTCPYCAGGGHGPSADGICNNCLGHGTCTMARYRESEDHRKRILAKYGRCSLPTPRLPLEVLSLPARSAS